MANRNVKKEAQKEAQIDKRLDELPPYEWDINYNNYLGYNQPRSESPPQKCKGCKHWSIWEHNKGNVDCCTHPMNHLDVGLADFFKKGKCYEPAPVSDDDAAYNAYLAELYWRGEI